MDGDRGNVFPVIDVEKTGQRIRELRRERGISTQELSRYLGLAGREAVYHWEWGGCLPSVDNLVALSKYLGVLVEDILVLKESLGEETLR